MPMTIGEAAAFVGKHEATIRNYIKAGRIAVVVKDKATGTLLVNAADVARIAGKPVPSDYAGEQPSIPLAGTVLLTEEVQRTGKELLKAMTQSGIASGLSWEEVEGKISHLLANLGDELEGVIERLLGKGEDRKSLPRRNIDGVKTKKVYQNPLQIARPN